MLDPNITMNLDHLANLGVLDYDAAAHIAGCEPRYVGNPNNPFLQPTVYTPLDGKLFTPDTDTFNGKSLYDKENKTPMWKKILFGAVAVASLCAIVPMIKNFKFANLLTPFKWLGGKAKGGMSRAWHATTNFFKNIWTKICNVFK